MLEETVSSSIPSIWASMNSWLTPAVLFLLLNLMIGTIAFTSYFPSPKKSPQQPPQHPPALDRSPSSVLQRLRSINLSPYRSQPSIPDSHETHQIQPQETETDNDDVVLERNMDEVYRELQGRHVGRTRSDTEPSSGEMPDRLPSRMRKSASMKSAFGHFEEGDVVEACRPATVKEGKTRVTEVDDEVDSKADDFINRFKQQLKLQRMDSIVRYKGMIGRGGC